MSEAWGERVERHRQAICERHSIRRGRLLACTVPAESLPPVGQAGDWYDHVAYQCPESAREVARQVARLCGQDSQVVLSWRSLADAVHRHDSKNRTRAYVETGARWLRVGGWLQWETIGSKRGASTTFYLLPGESNWRGSRIDAMTDDEDAA